MARVKLLRTALLPDLVAGQLTEAERDERWKLLAKLYLAQQLAFYPEGYLDADPTPERILETVERFEEDTTDRVRTVSPLRAVVTVGRRDRRSAGAHPRRRGPPDEGPCASSWRPYLAAAPVAGEDPGKPWHEPARSTSPFALPASPSRWRCGSGPRG